MLQTPQSFQLMGGQSGTAAAGLWAQPGGVPPLALLQYLVFFGTAADTATTTEWGQSAVSSQGIDRGLRWLLLGYNSVLGYALLGLIRLASSANVSSTRAELDTVGGCCACL